MLIFVSVLKIIWGYEISCTITWYTDTWNSWKVKLMSLKQKARTRILVTFMLAKINLRSLPNQN